jgi:hypothetical protein
MRARWASAWPVFGRRAQRSNVSHSSCVTVKGGIRRPFRIIASLVSNTKMDDTLLLEL